MSQIFKRMSELCRKWYDYDVENLLIRNMKFIKQLMYEMLLRIWKADLFSKHIELRCLLQKVWIFQPETSQLLRDFPSRLRSVDVICFVVGDAESQWRQKRGRKEWEEKEAIYWRGRRWTNVQRKEGKDRLLDGYQVRIMEDFIYPFQKAQAQAFRKYNLRRESEAGGRAGTIE